jgi:hypothetical protein
VRCGNDPTQPITPGDQAVVDWYREWLRWSKTTDGDRGPVPVCPDGRAINSAARAETTRCGQAGDE